MIKAVIFDLFGPIMLEDEERILGEHTKRKGFKAGALKKLVVEYYNGAHQGEFTDFYDFFDKAHPSLDITAAEMTAIFEEMHLTKRVIPETIELVKELRKKYKVALLTNFGYDLYRFIRDMFRIDGLFDVIVNSYEIKAKKPDHRAFLHVLGLLGVKPEEAVFIDDREANVSSAMKLGIKGIVYRDFAQASGELREILNED